MPAITPPAIIAVKLTAPMTLELAGPLDHLVSILPACNENSSFVKISKTQQEEFSKVPEVTVIFWIMKILATTLGETAGDAVSMSLNVGYLISTAIFALIFLVAVVIQIIAKKFHPMIYWMTIVATTTVGTTAPLESDTQAEPQSCSSC